MVYDFVHEITVVADNDDTTGKVLQILLKDL